MNVLGQKYTLATPKMAIYVNNFKMAQIYFSATRNIKKEVGFQFV